MRRKLPSDNRGFTLVEILISMALAAVVMSAVYYVYNYFLHTTTGQDRKLEIQQESRVAMERLSKDLRAAGCYYKQTPIIQAGANILEYEADIDPDPSKGPWKIKYEIDTTTKELKRSSAEWNGVSAYGAYSTQTMVNHITGLQFSYYDQNGNVTTDETQIRRVDVALTAATDFVNPATNKIDTIDLKTSVNPRCLGVEQSSDTTACSAPTNIQVADAGVCGRLNVSWTKSSSSDAAGYKIFYRPNGSSFYSGVVDVAGRNTEAYTVTGLQDGVQYDIAMKCYDTSGNKSDYAPTSAGVTGTSSPADTKPDDTSAPDLPIGLDTTAGDGYVNLAWTASAAVDTGGYNIYRSADGGINYTKVTEVDSNYLSYADTSVTNCPSQPYYYKVTSWDCAGNELPLSDQTPVYGDGSKSGGITDYPTNNSTDTNPVETTPPADPTSFSAVAGANTIYLSYTSPSDADVSGVRVLRTDSTNTNTFPSAYDAMPPAVGPNGVTDYTAIPSQTYAITDSGGVNNGTTYYYRAFAYDGCGLYSAGAISQATAKPCGDGSPGSEHYGPPNAPGSPITASVCGNVVLNWPASDGSEISGLPFDPASESDVVGYNVYRKTTGAYGLLNTGGPVTTASYTDSTVTAGNTYYYVIRSVDCANNVSSNPSSEITVAPGGVNWDDGIKVTTYGTSGISSSQHNIVKFGVINPGTSTLTLTGATVSWSKTTAYLKRISLIPYGVSSDINADTAGTYSMWNNTGTPLTASGGSVTFTTQKTMTSSNQYLMHIEFRESAAGAEVDMRGDTVIVTLNYTNSNFDSACTASSFSVPVLSGPTIGTTIQNKPSDPTTSNLNINTVTLDAGTQDSDYVWTKHTVTVQSTITPESGSTLSTSKLYYAATARSTSTAPSTDYSASPSGWTALTMCQVASSDNYQTSSSGSCTSSAIPDKLGKRVWYYIKSVDSNGNFDIQPEPSLGTYVYDQDSIFHTVLTVTRNNQGDVAITVDLKENTSSGAAVSGATVTADLTGSGGGTANDVSLTETSTAGTYTATVTTLSSHEKVTVVTTASKTAFTNTLCGIANVSKNTTVAKTCN